MTTVTLTRGQKAAATRKANRAAVEAMLDQTTTVQLFHVERTATSVEQTVDHSASNARIASMLAREQAADDAEIKAYEAGKATPEAPEGEDLLELAEGEKVGYTGPMLALRERLKAGAYKKAANGQPSCGDALAQALGVLKPVDVIRACIIALAFDANPYTHLNIGQQSMNLRNRVRNALTRGDFGMGVVIEAVEEVQQGE